MQTSGRSAFLALMVAQAAHSMEEYVFGLYDVFAPARFVSSLISRDLARGFAVANLGLVLFGIGCYLVVVRPGRPAERGVAWLWTLLELGNGIGHMLLAVSRGRYFPGLATAPFLLGLSLYLGVKLIEARQPS
jgi:hypothetical protein